MSGNHPILVFLRAAPPTLLTYAALLAWGVLAWQAMKGAPPGKLGGPITVQAREAPIVLGHKELGQRPGPRSAAERHLAVGRQGGQWTFGNRAQGRRVLLTTTRFDARFLERFALAAGDRISFPGIDIEVASVTADMLVLRQRGTGREATWDGRLAPKGEPVTEVCLNVLRRAFAAGKWMSRAWLGPEGPELRLFSIGGGVNCADRWLVKDLAPQAVVVVWQGGRFWLSPGALRDEMLLFRAGQTRGQGFADIVVPLEGEFGRVTGVVLGITRYRVEATPERLTLTPVANRDYFYVDEPDPTNRLLLNWIGAGATLAEFLALRPRALVLGAAAGAGAAGLVFLLWTARAIARRRAALGPLIHGMVAAGVSVFGLWITGMLAESTGNPDQTLLFMAVPLAWFWASFNLVWTGRLQGFAGWLWFLATVLAGIGAIALFQFGAGAENTRWLGFFAKHAAVLAAFGWGIGLLSAVPERAWRRFWLWLFSAEWVFAVLGVLLIGALTLQFFIGGEEGVAGFQPVELVKTVLVVLLGFVGLHIAEARDREVRAYRRSPLKFLWPYLRTVGLFFLLVAAMVMGVRDFSPLIIMAIVMLAWLWRVGAWQGDFTGAKAIWWSIRPLILLGIAGIVAGAYFVYQDPTLLPESFPKKERIVVWAEPRQHPHTGSQVLGSMDLVGEAGWRGARAWWGANGRVMTLPAVQNDFITAFYINRFGGLAGLVLLVVEMLFVTLLFMLARGVEDSFGRGDFREQNPALVMSYTLYLLAWMQATHWLISWGNTLGVLPVMGQPMTWLTAGTSHLLFFGLVVLMIGLGTGWAMRSYLSENALARAARDGPPPATRRAPPTPPRERRPPTGPASPVGPGGAPLKPRPATAPRS
jgi:cell division protein FtsW (lipid II flippase)